MAGRKRIQDWDDLRHFLAVARAGTLSAAAEALGTDHTTVARRVARLEERLASRLFYRSNSGYALTAQGERLLPVAQAMEAGYIEAASMERENPAVSGTVRIGAPDGFGTHFLAPRLGRLAALHAGLDIELMATARLFSLSKREADIVISLASPNHARVVSRRLTDYRLYLYAAADYLARHPPIRVPADIGGHTVIGYVEDMLFTSELNYLAALGEGVGARIRSTNLIAQVHATLGGGGLCVLPAFIARSYPALVPVLPGAIMLRRAFFMHIHEDNRKAAHVRAAAAFIAAEAEGSAAFFHQPASGQTSPARAN